MRNIDLCKVLVWDWFDYPTLFLGEESETGAIFYLRVVEWDGDPRVFYSRRTDWVDLESRCREWLPNQSLKWPVVWPDPADAGPLGEAIETVRRQSNSEDEQAVVTLLGHPFFPYEGP